jgi:hypothetical protein
MFLYIKYFLKIQLRVDPAGYPVPIAALRSAGYIISGRPNIRQIPRRNYLIRRYIK